MPYEQFLMDCVDEWFAELEEMNSLDRDECEAIWSDHDDLILHLIYCQLEGKLTWECLE